MSSPPTAQHAPGKAAMSRALGAAFLSHQVAQLERAVANSTSNPRDSTAPRRGGGQRGRGRGAGPAPGAGTGPGPKRAAAHRAHTSDDDNRSAQLPPGLSAVVLDASVLIYAPGAVKRWCKDDNGPDLVVPLEVLNTLDLLKKGTTLLAQRARAASRLLESFVGSDTRLRVQRDEAFVPWADVPLHSNSADSDHDSDDVLPPPEWLRRTLCCARWEVQPASDPLARPRAVVVAVGDPSPADTPTESATAAPGRHDARADGLLVKAWVPRVAGLRLQSVKPSSAGTAQYTDKATFATADVLVPVGPDVVPIVAPTTVPRARGKQLFDPKSDDAYSYADPLHPDSPRFSRQPAARKASQPVVPSPIVVQPRKRDEPQPMRVVRLLARGEKLDP